MKKETKHTPLPWQIGFKDGSGAGAGGEGIWIVGPGNATVVGGGLDDWGVKVGIRTPDDARLIESAVNNHEALLAALEDAASALNAAKRWLDGAKLFNAANSIAANADHARAAIKAAKPTQPFLSIEEDSA